jgi:hypothetical protein
MLPLTLTVFVSLKEKVEPEGCTNPLASNYAATAVIDDGSCIFKGCTDSTATNFNPIATLDDGTCTFKGCMDSTAANYNPKAT